MAVNPQTTIGSDITVHHTPLSTQTQPQQLLHINRKRRLLPLLPGHGGPRDSMGLFRPLWRPASVSSSMRLILLTLSSASFFLAPPPTVSSLHPGLLLSIVGKFGTWLYLCTRHPSHPLRIHTSVGRTRVPGLATIHVLSPHRSACWRLAWRGQCFAVTDIFPCGTTQKIEFGQDLLLCCAALKVEFKSTVCIAWVICFAAADGMV